MNTPTNRLSANTPRLFPTIIAGFNTVANHIQLIFLPLAVDLALWLGPKVTIKKLFQPFVDYLTKNMQALSTPDTQDQAKQTISLINQFFSQFNFNTIIRTMPVGIPSLISREISINSPIKNNTVIEAPSLGFILAASILLVLAGFLLGTVYFNSLARFTVTPVLPANRKKIFDQFGQSIVTTLILLAILLIILVPGTMIMTVAALISPAIGQFLILVLMFILLWLAIPLVFSPHGIFVLNQKAYPSMMLSIRMVRFFLPGTGTFIMLSVLISEGLNLLWTLPDMTSWLTLVGIFGHAFIVTALLAASFIYYRGGLKWMQESIQSITDPNIRANLGGPFGSSK